MDEPRVHYVKWNKSDPKGHVLCDFIYVTSGVDKTLQTEQISGCHGLGDRGGGSKGQTTKEDKGVRCWG